MAGRYGMHGLHVYLHITTYVFDLKDSVLSWQWVQINVFFAAL